MTYELKMERLSDAPAEVNEWGRTVEFTETVTFEERDGKTLVTTSDIAREEDRDAFASGQPGYLDAVERAVANRRIGS